MFSTLIAWLTTHPMQSLVGMVLIALVAGLAAFRPHHECAQVSQSHPRV